MKKVLLFGTIAGMVTMYACKKDEKIVTVTNTVHDTTKVTIIKTDTVTVFASGKINADSLTTGITLAYGAGVTGEFPAASTDAAAPVLDTTYSRKYQVIRSRYLTVYPPNVSGFVQGYYVQIAGAKSYFKIDYPAAEETRKAARQAKLARMSKATNGRQSVKDLEARGTGEGFIDSAIVIKLPASVHGDTFYVKYAAYDLQNRVSAPVTAMVVILPSGNAEFTQTLNGSWLKYERRYLRNGVVQEGGGDRIGAREDNGGWAIDTGSVASTYFNCNNNKLVMGNEGAPYFYAYSVYTYKQTYTFDGYGFNLHTHQYNKSWDSQLSTCSEMVYYFNYDYTYDDNGGYSYDAASKKLTYIRDGSNLDYGTYNVISVSGSEMILSDTGNEDDEENYQYQYRFIKQ